MLQRENFVFLLFSIFSIAIGMSTTYILANYFSIEDFGKIQFLLTLMGILTIFYFPGFDIVIQKEIFKQHDDVVAYVQKYIMPFGLLFLYVSLFIAYFILTENRDLLLFATIVVSFGLFDKTTAILNSKLRFKQLRYIELYTKISFFLYTVIIVVVRRDIETYLIGFICISIIVFLLKIIYSRKQLNYCNNANLDKMLIKYEGTKITLSSSYSILANWSEKLILGFIDLPSLSIFTIGQLFPRVLKDNVKILLTPTLNTWASKGYVYNRQMINRYKYFFIMIGLGIFLLFYFLIDFIISNFFIKYEDSIFIGQLLSTTLIFKFLELALMSSMALSSYTNIFNKINNISNSLKIAFVIILVPIFGIYGALASILGVEVLRFYLVIHEFRKL